ncbi:hypothetical protein Pelo_11526 [Pelomyxa schiedti]|nr:hypothetical protein Pelo_11526 [Pelomyxa schiedti]
MKVAWVVLLASLSVCCGSVQNEAAWSHDVSRRTMFAESSDSQEGSFGECPDSYECESGNSCCCEEINDVQYCATTPDGESWLCMDTTTWECCGCTEDYCVECNNSEGWICDVDLDAEQYICVSGASVSIISSLFVLCCLCLVAFI